MSKRPTDPIGDPEDSLIAERLDDLTIYKRLVHIAQELEWLSKRCWSVASGTAVAATARIITALASAVYRATLRDPP